MKEFFLGLLDWIYKKKCYFCGSSRECVKMCSKCYDTLEFLPVRVNRMIEGKKVYCAGNYSKNLQKLIRGLKYHRQKSLAYYLAKFMAEYWKNIAADNNYQVVPVPIFEARRRKRKYNHMELVAEEFARLTGCSYNPSLIKRVKDTKPQYNLKKIERVQNLKDAFEVNPQNLDKGIKLLLLDDICTTGSTFEEMIRELKKYQIDDIVCFTATTPFGE